MSLDNFQAETRQNLSLGVLFQVPDMELIGRK